MAKCATFTPTALPALLFSAFALVVTNAEPLSNVTSLPRTFIHSIKQSSGSPNSSPAEPDSPEPHVASPRLQSHVACPAASQPSRAAQCEYVRSHSACASDSLLDYPQFYYCTCNSFRILGFLVLLLWLASLFFMLGNTAADYFCPALEELSSILNLPPTVAGVTLLPLGNGAPDVFSSVASFMGAQQGEVGLNSVLGAAAFVVCVVAGSVCVTVSRRPGTFRVDRPSFLRDISFFILSLLALLVIVLVGKLDLFGALAFLALYVVYGALVAYSEMHRAQQQTGPRSPLLGGAAAGALAPGSAVQLQPLLSGGLLQPPVGRLPSAADAAETLPAHNLPQWMWIRKMKAYRSQLAHPHLSFSFSADRGGGRTLRTMSIQESRSRSASGGFSGTFPRFSSDTSPGSSFSLPGNSKVAGTRSSAAAAVASADFKAELKRITEGIAVGAEEEPPPLPPQYSASSAEDVDEEEDEHVDEGLMWGWEDEEEEPALWYTPGGFVEYFIKLPLTLPRMMTIPVHSKESWSRVWFTTSATMAPLFFIFIVFGGQIRPFFWAAAAGVGLSFGALAFFTSTPESPPSSFVPFWVACGFIMSMLWFYAIANELVSLLVTFGIVLKIDSAVLGLTVLAWGNSIGDFVANLALVQSGGPSRVQISWSGSFAGPLFNILIGLGASMVLSTWSTFPKAFIMPLDPSLPWLILFLCCVLLLVLFWLPLRGMKLDRSLGAALIGAYAVFISLRLLQIIGVHIFSHN